MFILARALVWVTLTVGFGLVFLPARILSWTGIGSPPGIGAPQWAGMLLTALGALIVIGSVASFVLAGKGTPAPFDPPRRLVTTGPFRFVRNPIYVGAIAGIAGASLYYGSSALLVYALVLALAFHLLVLFYEEPVLRRSFGTAYLDYCDRVPRWLPRFRHTAPKSAPRNYES